MELVTFEDNIEEIKIEDILARSNDKGKVFVPNNIGHEPGPRRTELEKEIIALDTLETSTTKAAEVHDTTRNVANRYANGIGLDEEGRAKVLGVKNNIADKAVAQLMETLNLFDPTCIEKPLDQIRAATMLANIVERVSDSNKGKGGNEVHLHLYGPRQNKIEKYEVIDI